MSGLIDYPAQIWLAVAPVDMRRGLDGLSSIVQQSLGHAPCAGSAFIFRNRAGNRIRLLLWDGNGVWLCQRRLYQGGLAQGRRCGVCADSGAVAMVGGGCRLAAIASSTTRAMAGVNEGERVDKKSLKPSPIKAFRGDCGIIILMNLLAKLEQLNLEPTAKSDVAAML